MRPGWTPTELEADDAEDAGKKDEAGAFGGCCFAWFVDLPGRAEMELFFQNEAFSDFPEEVIDRPKEDDEILKDRSGASALRANDLNSKKQEN